MGGLPVWGAALCPAGASSRSRHPVPPQVKELGAIIYNCSRLALDLEKTFQTYWVLGAPKAVLPRAWPQNFSSHINRFQPLRDRFDGVPTTAYFSVRGAEGACQSPRSRAPPRCPPGPQGNGLGSQGPGPGRGPPASSRLVCADTAPGEDMPSTGDRQPGRGPPSALLGGAGGLQLRTREDRGGPAHQVVLWVFGQGRGMGQAGPPSGAWEQTALQLPQWLVFGDPASELGGVLGGALPEHLSRHRSLCWCSQLPCSRKSGQPGAGVGGGLPASRLSCRD